MRKNEIERHEIAEGLDDYLEYYNAKYTVNQAIADDAKMATMRAKCIEPAKFEPSLIDRLQPVIWAAGVVLMLIVIWRVMA